MMVDRAQIRSALERGDGESCRDRRESADLVVAVRDVTVARREPVDVSRGWYRGMGGVSRRREIMISRRRLCSMVAGARN